jgi:hypothetical protein
VAEVKAGVFASDKKWRVTEGMPAWLWVHARMVGGGNWAGSSAGITVEIIACRVECGKSKVTEKAREKFSNAVFEGSKPTHTYISGTTWHTTKTCRGHCVLYHSM